MASKWQKEVTNYQRKRLLWPKTHENAASSEWTKAEKGHFVVYALIRSAVVLVVSSSIAFVINYYWWTWGVILL